MDFYNKVHIRYSRGTGYNDKAGRSMKMTVVGPRSSLENWVILGCEFLSFLTELLMRHSISVGRSIFGRNSRWNKLLALKWMCHYATTMSYRLCFSTIPNFWQISRRDSEWWDLHMPMLGPLINRFFSNKSFIFLITSCTLSKNKA